MQNTLEDFYRDAHNQPPFDLMTNPLGFNRPHVDGRSEQSAHMPLLKYFASQCNHVTEFGLREGFTTAALALGLNSEAKTLISYDITRHPIHNRFANFKFPCKWQFIIKDITSPGWQIEPTDFLFVDDLHTFNQVQTELLQHGSKVKRFLGFHDTYSQGPQSLDMPGQEGIIRAIKEYTSSNGWKLIYKVDFNHGLELYERV